MLALFKLFSLARRCLVKALPFSQRLRNAAQVPASEPNERAIPQNQPDLAVYPTHKEQTTSAKFAVFLVSEEGTRAHLVCLGRQSLRSAAELEQWLRMNIGPRTDVTLLGRFDSVHFIASETKVESLLFGKRYFEPAVQDSFAAQEPCYGNRI
jgi:hypothetical protein